MLSMEEFGNAHLKVTETAKALTIMAPLYKIGVNATNDRVVMKYAETLEAALKLIAIVDQEVMDYIQGELVGETDPHLGISFEDLMKDIKFD